MAADDEAPEITRAEVDAIAARLLGDLRTKLGGLHIDHARRVAARAAASGDNRLVQAALLHDVVEKAGISSAELSAWVTDTTVMRLVDVLSQRDDEPEVEYLTRVAADPMAYFLKRLDLSDKFDSMDTTVPHRTAAKIQHEARTRLKLLDDLAHRHNQRETS